MDSLLEDLEAMAADPQLALYCEEEDSTSAPENISATEAFPDFGDPLTDAKKRVEAAIAARNSEVRLRRNDAAKQVPQNPDLRWIFVPVAPLDTVADIRDARLENGEPVALRPLKTVADEEGRELIICDYGLKNRILEYFSMHAPSVRPTFVPHSVAPKNLDGDSLYSTLGIDTTMPQFRAHPSNARRMEEEIQQDTYPVHYFFYGTLADPERLGRLLGLPEKSRSPESPFELKRCMVRGGRLKTWGVADGGHSYRALVNGTKEDWVEGWVYVIETREQEMALRKYETAMYEVVRCDIWTQNEEVVKGLTFRFVG